MHEFRQIKKSALFHKNEKNAVLGNRIVTAEVRKNGKQVGSKTQNRRKW